VLIRVLQAIGKDPKLQRNYAWGDASKGKSVVFSHLIRATFPGKDESPESFAKAVKAANIDEDALLAVAFYAPQWARFIQAVIGWPLFEEAVWWIHAHTKDTSWRIEPDTRELWNAEVRKLTPLTLEDLVEGAVDVDWFHRVYEALGAKRWTKLNEFAKYASGGGGHTRAQLFADAMLGKVKRNALIENMMKKRRQDSVRALGLIPLDKKDPKKDVLKRYQAIQEFVRGSRQFGSQRQASEKLAARIAQENLARTAGYPDPIRLQWAMEGLASADLAKGPVTVKVKDVAVTLAIDADGLPEVSVARGEKPLKAIPPEAKKNEKVEELLERKTDLRRSASRMQIIPLALKLAHSHVDVCRSS
jgi:Trp operon repressor